jgi:hypothetical protein
MAAWWESESDPMRSFDHVADLKRAVDDALERKAHQLQQQYAERPLTHSESEE